ncbi:MAG: hypothetical protein ACRCUP_03455 [Mycoplasmatales bacterium]
MQFFDEIYVMRMKETANVRSLAVYVYENGFKPPMNYGDGSAASIMLFIIIIVITVIQLRVKRRLDA